MPTKKKPAPQKRANKYEKPVKVDATFNELVNMAVSGKGYNKAPKKSK